MKILNSEQIKNCDNFTIEHLPIASIDLMENAAQACVIEIIKEINVNKRLLIFCGKGNNGADGLAIARMLEGYNYQIQVFIIEHATQSTSNFITNLHRFNGFIKHINTEKDLPNINLETDILIDCILGNGLNKPITGLIKNVVEELNKAKVYKYAIDIPTGLFSNLLMDESFPCLKVNKTLTFQCPKLNFLFQENYKLTGDFIVLDIGWHTDAEPNEKSNCYYTTKAEIIKIYTPRKKFVSKYDFGHALIIAGSHGKIGAALLATKACIACGAGLTTAYIPDCGYNILQSSAPEAMCMTDTNFKCITEIPNVQNINAIGIGPGIGLTESTEKSFDAFMRINKIQLVIDADAINMLAKNPELLKHLLPNTILTPHFRELERLTKPVKTEAERLQLAIDFAIKYQVIVILKGAFTAIVNSNGDVHFNSTGNSSLSKGGSGDTLTGIIVSLLAQNYTPINAAILGVYIHGKSADICIKIKGKESVIASDIIANLGETFLTLS